MANIAETTYWIYGTNEDLEKMKGIEKTADNLYDFASTLLGAKQVEGCCISGSIFYHKVHEKENYIELDCNTKWDWQRDFIHALRKNGYNVDFNCEEPGCGIYASSIEGGMFGRYKVLTFDEEEYARDDEEAIRLVRRYLDYLGDKNIPAFATLDECKEYLDAWNKRMENEDHEAYIVIYEFEYINS